jgi:dolichol-phosphate mannosyltransferase
MTPIVVIPTFNEKENIKALIQKIRTILPKSYICIVDDNSPDGTAREVLPLTKKYKNIKLIKRTGKGGRGSAVMDGFKYGLKNKEINFFVEMDADFSHNPEELKKILIAGKNSDVVLASRYLRNSKIINWPVQRRAFSFLANKFAKFMLGVPIVDYTNGYRGYSRRVLTTINLNSLGERGYAVLMEMSYLIYKHGFKFKQIPSIFINRKRGQSNTSLKEILNALNAPLRIKLRHKSL